MMRCQIRGVLDLTQANLRDPRWWRRARLLFDEMERELFEESFKLSLFSLFSQRAILNADHDKIGAAVSSTMNKLLHSIFPWIIGTEEEIQKQQTQALLRRYKEATGKDPNDPAHIAEVEKVVRQAYLRLKRKREST
mgnify:CR=1 FL=1